MDECDSASFPFRTSDDIQVATSSPEKFDGDKGRYYKKLNHGGEYVIYKLDEGKRAKTVTAETWYYKSNNTLAADCTVETSADGTVFQPAGAVRIADDQGWANGAWRKVTFTASDLPKDAQYIKLNLGDTTETGALYAVQIGRVTIALAANYEKLLENKIAEAAALLDRVPAGNKPGMCPAEVRDKLTAAKTAAEQNLAQGAPEEELILAMQALTAAIMEVEGSIVYAVGWPDDAKLTASAAGSAASPCRGPPRWEAAPSPMRCIRGNRSSGPRTRPPMRRRTLRRGSPMSFRWWP